MAVSTLWGWSCGSSTKKVWVEDGVGACFADTMFDFFPATVLSILLSLSLFTIGKAGKRRSCGQAHPRKLNGVERLHLLEVCIGAVICFSATQLGLEWRWWSFRVILHDRPHMLLAISASTVSWALSATLARCVINRNSIHSPGQSYVFGKPTILFWAVQVACLCANAALRILPLHAGNLQIQAMLRIATASAALLFIVLAVAEEMELRRAARIWRADCYRMPSLVNLPNAPCQDAAPLKMGGLFDATFGWASPLLRRGYRRQLQFSDLFKLDADLQPASCQTSMWKAWTEERRRKNRMTAESGSLRQASLLVAMAKAYGWPYLALVFIKLASDILNFSGPILLNLLVAYLSDERNAPGLGDGTKRLGITLHKRGAYVCAALLGLSALLKAILSCQYSFLQGRMTCQLRTSITCMVFNKSLMLDSAQMASFSSGGVQTLMSVDAERVVNLCASLHELWSLPLQISAALVLLYTQVKFAFVAGVAVVLLLVPVNRWLAAKIELASITMMGCKDIRIRRVGELLRGIRQVKAAAWEPCFVARVTEARNGELQALAVRKYLDAMCVYFWAATPILMSLLTFSLFVLMGHDLTAPVVFSSLALFNVLIAPLNSFPWVLNGLVEAIVSVRRLQRYLVAPESKEDWAYEVGSLAAAPRRTSNTSFEFDAPPTPTFSTPLLQHANTKPKSCRFSIGSVESIDIPRARQHYLSSAAFGSSDRLTGSTAIVFDQASFTWACQMLCRAQTADKPLSRPVPAYGLSEGIVLRRIDLAVPQGSLAVVCGEIGAGKSSLLAAALGELTLVEGRVNISGSVAYVPQRPWIISGTLRDNILLGKPYNSGRYQAVVRACTLEQDFLQLADRDASRVGDRGAALSGGQRARLALARALYQDADVYLLDNILAAVDAPVATWLLQNAICGPLMQHKTRVLCSHLPACASAADLLVRIRNGRAYVGSTQEPLPEANSVQSEELSKASGAGPSSLADDIVGEISNPKLPRLHTGRKDPDCPSSCAAHDEHSEQAALLTSSAEVHSEEEAENREQGHVKWSVYGAYIAAMGPLFSSVILVSLILMQASRNGSDVWLSFWVTHAMPQQLRQGAPPLWNHFSSSSAASEGDVSPAARQISLLHTAEWWREHINASVGTATAWQFREQRQLSGLHLPQGVASYLSVLLLLAACNSLFTLIRAFSFAGGGLAAAQTLHSRLLNRVVRAPTQFFDAVPNGRILNRFSSDTATADDSLPFIANIMLANLASLLGVMAVLAYSQPFVLVLFIPLGGLYLLVQRYYQHTSREVRRLDSIARSPVYSGFDEVLEGRPSIRASAQQMHFVAANEAATAILQQTALAGIAVAGWLAMRLQLIAAVLVTAVAVLALLQHDQLLPGISSQNPRGMAGLVGLSLSYALPITGLLNGLLTSSAETEQEMVAVERLAEYCRLKPQDDRLSEDSEGPESSSPSAELWPSCGHVLLRDVWLQYRSDGPSVLKGISLQIQPGEKIGIVGRTGAGKSSVLGALLRLVETSRGAIIVDGKNIQGVSLRRLRRGICLVPQSPFLFQGSIRENLDPMREHTDRDMIRVLKDVHLWEILCGIGLSQAKECWTPREGPSQLQEAGTPREIERLQRSGVQYLSRSVTDKPGGGGSLLREMRGRPPICTSRTHTSPRSQPFAASASFEKSSLLSSSLAAAPPQLEKPSRQKNWTPVSQSAPIAIPSGAVPWTQSLSCSVSSAGTEGESLQGTTRNAGLAAAAASTPANEPQPCQAGDETGSEESQVETPRSSDLRLPLLRTAARSAPQGQRKRRSRAIDSPTSFSRFLRPGNWMDRLSAEPPAVLLHAGFGIQLLSMQLGEGGLGLSQGQQQLLCFARALLRKSVIVCLDECTAEVDPAAADAIHKIVQDQMRECTVIQVAHRLESVMGCNRVVVLEEGCIVEQGCPVELAKEKTSHFACMCAAQSILLHD